MIRLVWSAGLGFLLVACTTEAPLEPPTPRERTETTSTTTSVPPGTALLTELCVNEFMADNRSSWLDDTGAASDWVELHNPGTEALSLGGYFLTTDPEDPFAHALDDGLTIPGGGYLVFAADGLPELGAQHLSFRLSALGERIGLYRFDGAGEMLEYGAMEEDFSWARQPDCCLTPETCMAYVFQGSAGGSNAID